MTSDHDGCEWLIKRLFVCECVWKNEWLDAGVVMCLLLKSIHISSFIMQMTNRSCRHE